MKWAFALCCICRTASRPSGQPEGADVPFLWRGPCPAGPSPSIGIDCSDLAKIAAVRTMARLTWTSSCAFPASSQRKLVDAPSGPGHCPLEVADKSTGHLYAARTRPHPPGEMLAESIEERISHGGIEATIRAASA